MYRSPRIHATGIAALSALILLATLTATPADAAGPSVTMSSVSTGSIRQGAPFDFKATVRNGGAAAVSVALSFSLVSPGNATEVPFELWQGSVPAGGAVDVTSSVITGRYSAALGRYTITASIDGARVTEPLRFDIAKSPVRVPRFDDVTDVAGIDTVQPQYSCARWSSGAAWGYFDDDDDLDLYEPNWSGPAKLWISRGNGTFADEAAARGADNGSRPGSGAAAADYDNDGDTDIYVTNDGANRLYRNDGTGRFVDVAAEAGVADTRNSSGAAWGDYDADGYLDLYVPNYGTCAGDVFTYQNDSLYHNEGDGTFTDVTGLVEHDLTTPVDGGTIGAGFQAVWFDYNGDGRLDLFLANDFKGARPDANHLWRNDGAATDGSWIFTDVSVATGTAARMNSMGVAVADFDRDLDLDFAISNTSAQKLMRNNGGTTFTDVADRTRMSRPDASVTSTSITWGLGFFDFNLDGWEDLYIGAGPLPTNPDAQANEVFASDKKGRFLDLSAPSQADTRAATRGVAFADYDRDGRMDLYALNQNGAPQLFRNVTSLRNRGWLEVDAVGSISNRDGCGAVMLLVTSTGKLMRPVLCGSSLASSNDPAVHFGFMKSTELRKLIITWPSGKSQTIRDLRINRLMTVREPR